MALPNVNDPQVKKDIEENKVLAAIGYIGILCLLPLILKPKSAYCKFHGKQALSIFIVEAISYAFYAIPVFGRFLFVIGSVSTLILSILGLLKALKGEFWEMPYVAEYAKKINI